MTPCNQFTIIAQKIFKADSLEVIHTKCTVIHNVININNSCFKLIAILLLIILLWIKIFFPYLVRRWEKVLFCVNIYSLSVIQL
jgi:hypothetical protein